MRRSLVALSAVVALGACPAAFGADLGADAQNILGTYEGQLEIFTGKKLKQFGYAVTIYQVDAEKKEISLKTRCDDCEIKETNLRGCAVTELSPNLKFACTGEAAKIEYELADGVLKGNGTNAKGKPYTVSVKRAGK